ncbi:CLOCK-interacting pacemaker a [Megalops cyprinoides]|uniref:CLOCK-interacting pacemaker a n=1 Tax=Megalops cyprinoides TaxID=118141 RepID=UPI0018640A02|nr:CLOCK-interacting pacemaker a [Megalops cyprinoides]XP_036397375.1 CLOCK-interacting pacemaker a [Megalops cyprinoides]
MKDMQLAPAKGSPEQAAMSSKAKAESHRRPSSDLMDSMKTSKPKSERDSGFSDGSSGYLSAVEQMESEEAGRTVATATAAAAQGPQARPQVAVMAGSFPGLSPMIIMNNVVLKQPNTPAPTLKPWGFQPTLEMLPQPQVVFLQPVVSNSSTASQKSGPDKRRRSRKYLPILKSYPKIAPHPGESSLEKSGSSSSERSSSSSSQGGQHRPHHRREKQPGSTPDPTTRTSCPVSPSRHGILPPTTTADTLGTMKLVQATNSQGSAPPQVSPVTAASLAEAGLQAPWAWPAAPAASDSNESGPDAPADSHSKRQRFCNTYNILNRSGLLGITLRTKELIRQNRRTQGQLERLREHTSLFVEALRSGDPQVWTKLQLAMMEASPGGAEEEPERREKEAEKDAPAALL